MTQDDAANALIQYIAESSDTAFSDAERDRIRGNIKDKLRQAATLREQSLQNGEEPYSVFKPYRAEG